jgi:hypothetical protein
MGDEVEQDAVIAVDPEVEAPSTIHSRLPDVHLATVFLDPERWVTEILVQVTRLFRECATDVLRSPSVASPEAIRVEQEH